ASPTHHDAFRGARRGGRSHRRNGGRAGSPPVVGRSRRPELSLARRHGGDPGPSRGVDGGVRRRGGQGRGRGRPPGRRGLVRAGGGGGWNGGSGRRGRWGASSR